ncbi:MAG: hypothetical protein F7B59_04865 [Desulfurococcales archaeon]|nr:hypothetical protein [Desulfurococcales archaeon]
MRYCCAGVWAIISSACPSTITAVRGIGVRRAMVSFGDFIAGLSVYLRKNDREAFNRIDSIARKGICREEFNTGFHHAYMYYLWTRNLEGAKRIILEHLENCKESDSDG